jgi:hypothetical protein
VAVYLTLRGTLDIGNSRTAKIAHDLRRIALPPRSSRCLFPFRVDGGIEIYRFGRVVRDDAAKALCGRAQQKNIAQAGATYRRWRNIPVIDPLAEIAGSYHLVQHRASIDGGPPEAAFDVGVQLTGDPCRPC